MNLTSLIQSFSQTSVTSNQSGKTLSSQVTQVSLQSLQQTQMTDEEQQQSALQLLSDTLAKAYEHIRSNKVSATDQYRSLEPLSAEKVANNVLGFIERRLKLDQADGATQEQLSSRLEAGLDGFKRGFSEAQEKLKSLNLLSDNVSADIGKTYDLVIKGVDELSKKYLGASPGIDAAASPATDSTQVKSTKENPMPAALAQAVSNFSLFGAASARDFSFVLTTKEGDKVRINASSSQGLGLAADSGNQAISTSSSDSFSFKVKGNLNDSELAAINDLLGKVNDLASQFYGGNLDEAWSSALALGFDDSQITGFSLRLVQVDVQRVQTAVPNSVQTNESPGSPTASAEQSPLTLLPGIAAISQFMSSLLDSLGTASLFADPAKLLEDIAAGFNSTAVDANKTDSSGAVVADAKRLNEQAGEQRQGFREFMRSRLNDLHNENY